MEENAAQKRVEGAWEEEEQTVYVSMNPRDYNWARGKAENCQPVVPGPSSSLLVPPPQYKHTERRGEDKMFLVDWISGVVCRGRQKEQRAVVNEQIKY